MVSSEDMQPDRNEGHRTAKSQLNHLNLAEYNLRFTLELIRFADRKAQNLLRLTLAIFTVALIGVPPAVMALRNFAEGGGWRLWLFAGTVVLYMACSACLLGSMVCIVRVIRPRREKKEKRTSVLFFDSIAEMKQDEFLRTLRGMDYDGALTEMGIQMYQSAKIARAKYAAVDTAIRWLLHGVLIGIVFALIMLVSLGFLLEKPQAEVDEPVVKEASRQASPFNYEAIFSMQVRRNGPPLGTAKVPTAQLWASQKPTPSATGVFPSHIYRWL